MSRSLGGLTPMFESTGGGIRQSSPRTSRSHLSVSYPDGWSTLQSGRLTMVLDVPPISRLRSAISSSSPRR